MKITDRMAWTLSATGRIACFLSFAGLLAACSSTALEETTPSARSTPRTATQPDGYPNLNVPVQAASPQLTESDRRQLTERLTATIQNRPEDVDLSQAAAEAERLRRLARERAERKRVENSIEEQSATQGDRLRQLAVQNARRSADAVETSSVNPSTEADRLRRLARQLAEQNAAGGAAAFGQEPSFAADRLRLLGRRHAEQNASEPATSGEDRSSEAERLRRLGLSHGDDALNAIDAPRLESEIRR